MKSLPARVNDEGSKSAGLSSRTPLSVCYGRGCEATKRRTSGDSSVVPLHMKRYESFEDHPILFHWIDYE